MKAVPIINEAIASGGILRIESRIKDKFIFSARLVYRDGEHTSGPISTSINNAIELLEERLEKLNRGERA